MEKQHIEKEEYSDWRKKAIRFQNKYWADVPLTVVSIFSLLFIPAFQYCHVNAARGEPSLILLLTLIWLNFIISWAYLIELVIKVYAFGIRRAWSGMNWAIKCEFFFQPMILLFFIMFMFDFTNLENDYEIEGNLISIGILFRAMRITYFMRELKIWRNFIRAMQALIKPFTNLAMALYSLYLIYASLGVAWFGGMINSESIIIFMEKDSNDIISPEWVYLNFNDFVMAMNTLFGFMW